MRISDTYVTTNNSHFGPVFVLLPMLFSMSPRVIRLSNSQNCKYQDPEQQDIFFLMSFSIQNFLRVMI